MRIGVLALQGNFAEHVRMLQSLQLEAIEVRTVEDFSTVDALVLPGGESTVISTLLLSTGLHSAIQKNSLPIFGTCAGAILLASSVQPAADVTPLGLLDMTIERNAYGRQAQSQRASLQFQGQKTEVAFIRAPRIVAVGKNIQVLAEYKGDPVLVQQGNRIASTFHTEVTGDTAVHRLFLQMLLV